MFTMLLGLIGVNSASLFGKVLKWVIIALVALFLIWIVWYTISSYFAYIQAKDDKISALTSENSKLEQNVNQLKASIVSKDQFIQARESWFQEQLQIQSDLKKEEDQVYKDLIEQLPYFQFDANKAKAEPDEQAEKLLRENNARFNQLFSR